MIWNLMCYCLTVRKPDWVALDSTTISYRVRCNGCGIVRTIAEVLG